MTYFDIYMIILVCCIECLFNWIYYQFKNILGSLLLINDEIKKGMVLTWGSTVKKILRGRSNEKLESNCQKNVLIIQDCKKKWKTMSWTVKNVLII